MPEQVRLEGVGLGDRVAGDDAGPVAALPQPVSVKLGDVYFSPHVVPDFAYDKNLIKPSKRGGVLLTLPDGTKVQIGIPMWANKDVFFDWVRQGGFSGGISKEDVHKKIATTFIFDPDYVRDGFIPLDFEQYLFFVTNGTTMHLVLPNEKMAIYAEAMLDLAYMGERQNDLNDIAANEFPENASGKPRLLDELQSFDGAPTHQLRSIHHFNAQGRHEFQNGIALRKLGPLLYGVYQGDTFLGRVNLADYPLPKPEVSDVLFLNPLNQQLHDNFVRHGHAGVWPLGTAHGFDVAEETSGHMIWNKGRFVLVDPPSITLPYLEANRIPLDLCDGVIITHGHSDHFGNAINHLLEKLPRVNLYATESIYTHLMVQYSLAQGGLGPINWQALGEAFHEAVSDSYPDLSRRFLENQKRPNDDPKNLFLYVDLLMVSRKDSRLAEFGKKYLLPLNLMMGGAHLGDWNFVELKPKEEIKISGLNFVFNYGYHPIPAKGHEIWATFKDDRRQLQLYFTGDTMAVASDQVVFGKNVKGIWGRIHDGVMSLDRGLDILKHYFLIPLTSLASLGEKTTRQKTGQTLVDLVLDFVVSENKEFKLNEHPSFVETVRQYVVNLAKELRDQKEMPHFLIEGGIAGIHIPPAVTQGYLNAWTDYLSGKLDVDVDVVAKIAGEIRKKVLIYHTSEKPTADVGATRWQAGYRGIVDFNKGTDGHLTRPAAYWRSRLRHDFVLKEAPETWLKKLLQEGQIVVVNKGEKIISKESSDESIYFILQGRVSVLRADGEPLVAKDSGFIGEGPLLGEVRSHEVRADEETTVLRLSSKAFDNRYGRQVVNHLKSLRYNRATFTDFLAATQLTLKGLSALWDGLLQYAKPQVLSAGSELFAKGDTSRSLYFITGGTALVKLPDKNVSIPPGQFVGEMAYALGATRSATVKAGEQGLSVLEITPDHLDAMVAVYPGLGADIRQTALAHMASGLGGLGAAMVHF